MPPALWFFENLVRVHVSSDDSDGRASVIEVHAGPGDMPPLHIHRVDDEVFHLLSGAMTFYIGERELQVAAGETAFTPSGVPHTYRVESAEGATWLVFTPSGQFASFVDAVARPAKAEELPPHAEGPPSPEQAAELSELAAEYDIEILGPPGMLPSEL